MVVSWKLYGITSERKLVEDRQTANKIQAFKKNGTTGALTYIGSAEYLNSPPVAFLGNNQYAYNVNCINGNASWPGAHRNSNGTLSTFSINPPLPSKP
jgi:hypothetical protein